MESVAALAAGAAQLLPDGSPDPDRDWRWRTPGYTYSPSRAAAQPGYVGSYAMDALAMALHCVHATSTYRDAVLLAANMRGDADTVAAVTGQLAGALYGLSAIPAAWVAAVERWDGGGSIADRAHCLFQRVALGAEEEEEQSGGCGEGGGAASAGAATASSSTAAVSDLSAERDSKRARK